MDDRKEKEYRYDAFISYRHLPLDMAVAQKLQTLLETYRPPKNLTGLKRNRIKRVFRDQSELPTSGDLGSDIRQALLDSRYLIVVCSEETKNSLWCMEEIRMFKEAHRGHTDHILPLLVSGEPSEVFPVELLWEPKRTEVSPDVLTKKEDDVRGERESGSGVTQQEEWVRIEPLSADVRAKSRKESLKKLKVEFLRIAAPLLGCSFDGLYQRHQKRRRRRIMAVSGGSAAVLLSVLLIVSVFAYRTWVSEENYREMLAGEYIREASEYALDGDIQHALLYYTEALSADQGADSASAGAALLLQDYLWPVKTGEEAGTLREDRILSQEDPDPGWGTLLSEHGGVFQTFLSDDTLTFYDSASGKSYQMEKPSEYSRGCEPDEYDLEICDVSAVMLAGDRAAVAYGGLIHIYELTEEGEVLETVRADLADAFPEDAEEGYITLSTRMWLSEDSSVLIASTGAHAAVYETEDLTLRASVQQIFYGLSDVAVSRDNQYFLLAYSNMYALDYRNPGSYFQVYDMEGNCAFTSQERSGEAIRGAVFHPEDSSRVIVWDRENVRYWNWETGKQEAAPVCVPSVVSAAFGEEGSILVDNGAGTVSEYKYASLNSAYTGDGSSGQDNTGTEGDVTSPVVLENGMSFVLEYGSLCLMDGDGETADTAEITDPLAGEMVWSPQQNRVYVYNRYQPFLICVDVDTSEGTLGVPEEFDIRGIPAASFWFEPGITVIGTGEGSLLVYDGADAPVWEILPEHTGETELICSDGEGTYLAVAVTTVLEETGQGAFSERGSIELYNLRNGILTASFEEQDVVDTLSFDENGALLWSCGDTRTSRQIRMPEADEAAMQFLREMCCLDLEAGNAIICKDPESSGFTMGSWDEKFAGWTVQETQGEQDSEGNQETGGRNGTFTDRVTELLEAEDYGTEEWFARCDSLWQEMLDGTQDFSVIEMDYFYRGYRIAAKGVMEERLVSGLEAYITLLEQSLLEAGEGEAVYTELHTNFLDTFDQTLLADEALVKAYRSLGSASLEDVDFSVVERILEDPYDLEAANELVEYCSALEMIVTADLLESGTSEYMDDLLSAGQFPYMSTVTAGSEITMALLSGDAENAAAKADETIAGLKEMGAQEDVIESTVSTWMTSASALSWRGQIDETVLNEFLENISVDSGIEVTAVTTEAQAVGLQVKDLIIGVRGKRIAGENHFSRLLDQEQDRWIEVLRDGVIIRIDLPADTGFSGKMTVRTDG